MWITFEAQEKIHKYTAIYVILVQEYFRKSHRMKPKDHGVVTQLSFSHQNYSVLNCIEILLEYNHLALKFCVLLQRSHSVVSIDPC